MNNVLRFKLDITANDYLRHYQGHARDVLAQSTDGVILSFPAENLRSFVQHDGVHGLFELEFDQHNKLIRLRKISTQDY